MPQIGQGTCGMLSSSLEAATVLYYIFLDVVQNGEQKRGKDVADLPTQQLPQWPCGARRKATRTCQPTAQRAARESS